MENKRMFDPISIARQAVTWLPLLREALEHEGRFRWPLQGNSMIPTLPLSCEIEVTPLQLPVRLGEVIIFVDGDTLIAHRLVARAHGYWIAQGDNRLAPDRPLRPDQVLGRVSAAYQDGRRCWPRRFSLRPYWIIRHHVLRLTRAVWHKLRR
jgi:hypothetical protein